MATSSTTHSLLERRSTDGDARWGSRLLIAALELLVGVGAVLGGWQMLADPLHPLGVTPALLEGTPFADFVWPGFFLVSLVGVPPLVLAPALLARVRGALPLSGLYGVGLMAWIVVQWVLIDDRLWLQPVIFGLGAVLAVTAGLAWRRGAR
jgi:hypothetical protein